MISLLHNCITCNKRVQDMIWDGTFYENLLTLFLAFIIIAVIVVVLSYLSGMRHQAFMDNHPMTASYTPVPLTTAAMVLGIGIGGFIDGIVLHQLLQWHQMLTNVLPPDTLEAKSVNMFWDGIFHLFTLIVTLVGIVLLWRLAGRRYIDLSFRMLAGGMLSGWGIFNIVEGTVNHHILKLHNVRDNVADPDIWNYGFLAISVVMFIVGFFISRNK
ncbi:DUF2243 domain-containing protein [Flavobacterium sp. J372]|uniref:DUF2243 domain-containing protein n=1 Tax=Flavobacterium sp. J372 TaxID=2898436 RepID=UPI0021514620|nr:DUF2243 domain-containing protein [Flavobacterium sp. J372]MCR5862054.1 DUF2243 domain-containing protein [Flavobacterium sp. J372]